MLERIHKKLDFECVPVGALRPDPRNPRRHSKRQIGRLKTGIRTFGFIVPILSDRSGMIIAGHARHMAARELGLVEVPVIRIEGLSEAQVRAFQIADNRLTDLSDWNAGLLAQTLSELSSQDLDFSIEATGFDIGEIDLLIEELNDETAEVADAADQVPSPGLSVVSKSGDLWLLGGHRVLCGNSLDRAAHQMLMGTERAAVVFADAPYNVEIRGNVSGLGAIQHRDFAMATGEMNSSEFVHFLILTVTGLIRSSIDGSIHFICMDWRHASELLEAGKIYTELKNICVWCKPNGGMGSFYRSAHELVFVFKSGRGQHRNNVQLGKFGRNRTNVWTYPNVSAFGRGTTDEGNLLELHPTVKPVRLIADAILDCSARGDTVLDPFLGSGSTLIAAERIGRRCFGMELDPLYVDTAIRRWQAYSGERALHAVTGRLFDEIEVEVCRVQ
jgi:hypothetical protein